ncbi:RNA polymerase sigma factor [Algoriphagus sp. CAU 1675]|uniref:RNA polymerase sigma factor n=1 Tax=Algoriphagus sp. CAU 1675 TaxID=3032597 RepID=UPI0023DB1B84|nr:RNA polymerase sigma factor [Algoriphagus sp. CAU 1675]MDF2158854.1 RNA polymerase sigma factor [Algoriphagus sp. CAU 1675]
MKRNELEHILKEYHRDAYLWARQCCGFDEDLAKDVLQICYLKILEGKARLQEIEKSKSWLFSVIRFTAIDELRKNNKNQPLLEEFDRQETYEELDSTDYQEIISQLPIRQREVILMVFYHQMTLEQCANILEVSIGTARTHYDRGKKKLRELILKNQTLEQNGK